ncbi:MAG: DUF3500 domain-containing protein, partial [Phycisphaerae bacterium]|nr:DUF3500 domain-containing protein [Phycisphaerae bacterium]
MILQKLPCSAPRRMVLLALVLTVLAAAPAFAHEPAEEMAAAAGRWLASLTAEQKAGALFDFGHADRQGWHFVPDRFIKPRGGRLGLKIGDMTVQQRLLAQALVSTGLSAHGYRQSRVIMSLEQVLYDLEKKNPIRDPSLYYLSIFGKPAADGTWAWRFEGHHLSINFTLVKGKQVSVTPSFFGANPGAVRQGAMSGLRVLHDEEDLARKLVKSFSPEHAKLAVIQAKAPRDIITGQNRRADK